MRTQTPRLRGDFGNEGGGGGGATPVANGAYFAGTNNDPIQGGAGWIVIAEFDLDTLPPSAILDAIALVSNVALTVDLKVFKVTAPPGDVAGSAISTTSLTGGRITSGDFVAALVLGSRYQIQARCTGGSTAADWAVVRYATVVQAP